MAHIPEKPTNQFSKELWQNVLDGLKSGRIESSRALEMLKIDERAVVTNSGSIGGFISDLIFYVVINHLIEGSEKEDVPSDSGDPGMFFVKY